MPSWAPDSMKLVRFVTASARLAEASPSAARAARRVRFDRHVGEFLRDEIAVRRDDRQDHEDAQQQYENRFDHCATASIEDGPGTGRRRHGRRHLPARIFKEFASEFAQLT